jgi:hypothetical protein
MIKIKKVTNPFFVKGRELNLNNNKNGYSLIISFFSFDKKKTRKTLLLIENKKKNKVRIKKKGEI